MFFFQEVRVQSVVFCCCLLKHIQNQNREFSRGRKRASPSEEQVGRMWVNSNSFGRFCKFWGKGGEFSQNTVSFFFATLHILNEKGKVVNIGEVI